LIGLEYKDLMCPLLDHTVETTDELEVINGRYLAKLASDDWGIYTTFKKTIQRLLGALDEYSLTSQQRQVIKNRGQEILRMIEEAPKTMRWRMRAGLGEKLPWCELPEVDKEIVN
jgi:hypothetical protein